MRRACPVPGLLLRQVLAVAVCLLTGRVCPLGAPWVPNSSVPDGRPALLSDAPIRMPPGSGLAPLEVGQPIDLPAPAAGEEPEDAGGQRCHEHQQQVAHVPEQEVEPRPRLLLDRGLPGPDPLPDGEPGPRADAVIEGQRLRRA